MNIRLPLLPFAIAVGMAAATAQPAAMLARAQDHYAKGDYAQALAAYDSIATTQRSAALLYNIGNCHMKLDDVPRAILYYERAIRLQPGAEDIQANLDHARSLVVDRVNELPAFSLGSLWDRLRGGKDVDQWARRSLWLCLLTFVLAAVALALRRPLWRRAVLATSALGLLATLIAMALAGQRVAEVNDRSEGIIMQPKVDVLGEPRTGAITVFVLHEGTKVDILQEQNGWYEVKLGNGSVGWAAPASLVII